jgi:transcriptional regulator with XRE-family HTH domain
VRQRVNITSFFFKEMPKWCYKSYMVIEYFLENLRFLMKDVTQAELAKGTGIARSSIAGYFGRKTIPNPVDIEKLASFFNVKPHYFFMEPGTQLAEEANQASDDFKNFIDSLAKASLAERDYVAYIDTGGAATFLRVMRSNFESDNIGFSDWYLILSKRLTEYAGLDLVQKVKARSQSIETKHIRKA